MELVAGVTGHEEAECPRQISSDMGVYAPGGGREVRGLLCTNLPAVACHSIGLPSIILRRATSALDRS